MRDSTSLACLLACVGGCGSDEVLVEENENEPVALAWLGLLFVSAESTTKQFFCCCCVLFFCFAVSKISNLKMDRFQPFENLAPAFRVCLVSDNQQLPHVAFAFAAFAAVRD